MVARKEDGSPCPVPPLEIETEIERRLFEAGKMRKEMRKEIMVRNTALHVGIPISGFKERRVAAHTIYCSPFKVKAGRPNQKSREGAAENHPSRLVPNRTKNPPKRQTTRLAKVRLARPLDRTKMFHVKQFGTIDPQNV